MNYPKLIASYQVVEEWEKALKRSRRSSAKNARNMKPIVLSKIDENRCKQTVVSLP